MPIRRVYPCVCGFTAKSMTRMKYHRLTCTEWRNRPNPRGLMLYRRKMTRQQVQKVRIVGPCVLCGQWVDHKNPLCLESHEEIVRREALLKQGINPADFELILRVLAKRYQQEP